jgi:hypothetical protein
MQKTTSIVNISKASLRAMGYADLMHWLENPDHIYIGRNVRYVVGANQSKWANPFSKKKYGHARCVEMYKDYITHKPALLSDLSELEGKVLGCWCKPAKCHGDILVELINGKSQSCRH